MTIEPRAPSGDDVEVFVGLIGAAGTEMANLEAVLQETFEELRFKYQPIRLSRLLRGNPRWKNLRTLPEDARYQDHMDAGDELRSRMKVEEERRASEQAKKTEGSATNFQESVAGAAMALLGITNVLDIRGDVETKPIPRNAYIFRSLKNPKEVELLRDVYGDRFLAISSFAPREERVRALSEKIARSCNDFPSDHYREKAEKIVIRDEEDIGNKLGQNVRDTFPLADLFLDMTDLPKARAELQRFIELYFGNSLHSPSRDEYSMFLAHGAAMRSSSLSRQVGAVISTQEGDVIAVGTNEVPKFGGGLYWEGDNPDARDIRLGSESNDTLKRDMFAELLKRLRDDAKWIPEDSNIKEMVSQVFEGNLLSKMKTTRVMNLIEFIRCVHAEMAAITDAARRGVSVKDSTLYCTTYPCHECARHIVAAGIERVVYIEPYPKSLAAELHKDSITTDKNMKEKVRFEPFVGVSPWWYLKLFKATTRKLKDGSLKPWDKRVAEPRYASASRSYLTAEIRAAEELRAVNDWLLEEGTGA